MHIASNWNLLDIGLPLAKLHSEIARKSRRKQDRKSNKSGCKRWKQRQLVKINFGFLVYMTTSSRSMYVFFDPSQTVAAAATVT